jgi:hypothetical protein
VAAMAGRGISSSGAPGIADTLVIDQEPESAASRWTGSAMPAAARVVRMAASIGASCWRSLACWVSSAATTTCWQVAAAWAL